MVRSIDRLPAGVIAGLLICLIHTTARAAETAPAYQPRPQGEVTFNKHIAPIVFKHLSLIHI